jgi:hypothetical protein
MENVVFWDVTPCGSCNKRTLVVTANGYPSSLNHSAPVMEVKRYSETPVLNRHTASYPCRRHSS